MVCNVIMIKNVNVENKFRLHTELQVVICKPNTWCKSKYCAKINSE